MRKNFITLPFATGATVAAILNLSLGACSPVVLQDDTDTDTEGASSSASDSMGSGTEGSDSDSGESDGEEPEATIPAACIDLVPRVLGVLESHCAKCHGPGSGGQGGIGYILDLNELIATGKVVPGDPENSRIYARMVNESSPMPPLTEEVRPQEIDQKIISAWISDCAGKQDCAEQEFIPRDTMLGWINADLGSGNVSLANIPFTRYFSFVHLHNAGWCDSEIDIFREALSKLVNSLSLETLIVEPVPIDEGRLVYRIDISDYGWSRDQRQNVALSEPSFYFKNDPVGKPFDDVWEMIADQNPYTIEYLGELSRNIKDTTETNFPVMQGDAFIDVASRSPLYYDILDIPERSAQLRPTDPSCNPTQCLADRLNVDILKNIEDELANDKGLVARAGFKESDVSDFNRVIERHRLPDANNRVFWISYDFASESGKANISVNPLDFDFDGGEIIFNLPNGLQAYMLTDAAGTRLNEGPVEIVQDKSQKDFLVRNGVSCMGCHSVGMIKVQDDVRHDLDSGQTETQFDDDQKDDIRRLYPRRTDFDKLLETDIITFNEAQRAAGVTVGGEKEQIITTFLSFDEDVSLRRVGAEFGLREEDMAKNVGKLSPDLTELSKTGGTVKRKDFTFNFAASVCELNIGRTRCCLENGVDAGAECNDD